MSVRPEIRQELFTLPDDERQALADEMADVVANRVELIDADEVHAELRAELRDARR